MKRLFKNKVLAFVIALMMIASTFPMGIFSVSATTVQGEAIEDADDFAAMEPDGTYYLANSITLTETYAIEFTGKFNGNGQTITVSAPIFGAIMNATVENFTVTSDSAVTAIRKYSWEKPTELKPTRCFPRCQRMNMLCEL